jgi:hypothetical protein
MCGDIGTLVLLPGYQGLHGFLHFRVGTMNERLEPETSEKHRSDLHVGVKHQQFGVRGLNLVGRCTPSGLRITSG